MIFNCPHCDQELEIDDEGAGLTVPCPNCGLNLVVPEVDLIEMPAAPVEAIEPSPSHYDPEMLPLEQVAPLPEPVAPDVPTTHAIPATHAVLPTPPPAVPVTQFPTPTKSLKAYDTTPKPSAALRWLLFALVLLGLGAAIYFTLMAPPIIPEPNPLTPESKSVQTPRPAPLPKEKIAPTTPEPPADTPQE